MLSLILIISYYKKILAALILSYSLDIINNHLIFQLLLMYFLVIIYINQTNLVNIKISKNLMSDIDNCRAETNKF